MVRRYFPNLRSFIVSMVVILILLTMAVVITDQNNVRRLHRYLRAAETVREACYSLIEQRLAYAKALVRIIDGQVDTGDLEEAILQWDPNAPVDVVSVLYRALDDELSLLQRKAVEHESYRDWSPYFDQMYLLELELADISAQYQQRAIYFNAQKDGFPALLVAKRHNLEDLLLFDFGSALKGRP
ncbi:MAG: hypothetical protein GX313_06550 [Spirochaetales bacterium]|nr:hypothetical protein [Spirochaetales bacterium]